MNVDNGNLYQGKSVQEALKRLERVAPLTPDQFLKSRTLDPSKRKNWMRNQPCPCKSGKKFKRCHWNNTEALSEG